MSDADRLRSEAQLCFDIAMLLSDRVAAAKLRCEAARHLARATELDAREIHARRPVRVTCGRRVGKNFLTFLQHRSGAVTCPAC
jgi:hypothetical protein